MRFTTHNQTPLEYKRRELRNTSTPEEIILWNYLKDSKMGVKFRRQTSIGNYIADFYCSKYKYVIELDGSQHAENKERDIKRDNYLLQQGCRVRRFWNNMIHTELQNTLDTIWNDIQFLQSTTPTSPTF